MNELQFIEKLRNKITSNEQTIIGMGDDCAVLNSLPNHLITTDMLLDGRHFDSSKHSPLDIINKAFAVNCSDIYAMGGLPVFTTLAISFPSGYSRKENFIEAIIETSAKYAVTIIGGDTNSWLGPIVITLTMTGIPVTDPILRSTASIDDIILVTGRLGGSLKSKRHLYPPNHRGFIQFISKNIKVSSMVDISDGLATDLGHILRESKVGATLIKDKIPIHPDAKNIDQALCDGEDFELCFTVDQKNYEKLKQSRSPFDVFEIGKIDDDVGKIHLLSGGLEKIEYRHRGFQH